MDTENTTDTNTPAVSTWRIQGRNLNTHRPTVDRVQATDLIAAERLVREQRNASGMRWIFDGGRKV